jgi:hypothetical protein
VTAHPANTAAGPVGPAATTTHHRGEQSTGYQPGRNQPVTSSIATSAAPATVAPLVTTLMRSCNSWPRTDGEKFSPLPDPVTLADALTRRWSNDRHFTAYAPFRPTPDHVPVRVNVDTPSDANPVSMQLLIADVDHETTHGTDTSAPQEWRDDIRARLPKEWCVYDTFGGLRIMFTLEVPWNIVDKAGAEGWSEYYLTCLGVLRRLYNVEADVGCKDFTRMYRLPGADRPGKMVDPRLTTTEPPLWDDAWLTDADLPAPAPPKKRAHSGGTTSDAAELHVAKMYIAACDDDECAERQWLDWKERGSKLDIACPGEHNSESNLVNGSTAIMPGSNPGACNCKHTTCSLRSTPDDANITPKLLDWLVEHSPAARVVDEAKKQAEQQAASDAIDKVGEIMGSKKTGANDVEHPTLDTTGCRLNGRTGWPWILQSGNQYWLHAVNESEYPRQCVRSEFGAAIARHLDKQIGIKSRNLADLQNCYIRNVQSVRMTYTARSNTYDPATDTLTLATLNWTKRAPKFHEGIDIWLRALFGAKYANGVQWLASLVDLNRPAPCLFLVGGKDIGKSLLACGLASLWGVPEPAEMAESISQFNESTVECPLVFSDEELPKDLSFGVFREMITKHSRRVNRKGLSKVTLLGCVRVILAANNDQLLRYQKTGALTRADVDAIADRLLVIDCPTEGAGLTAVRKAVAALDTDAVATYQLAEHVLHLAATVPLTPKGVRMAAKPGGGERLLGKVVANRHSEILMKVRTLLEPNYQSSEPALVEPADDDAVTRVHVQGLFLSLCTPGCRVSLADVQEFCDAHKLRNSEQHKLGKRNVMWRILDRASVRAALEGLD